jgi:hypothetical protein
MKHHLNLKQTTPEKAFFQQVQEFLKRRKLTIFELTFSIPPKYTSTYLLATLS